MPPSPLHPAKDCPAELGRGGTQRPFLVLAPKEVLSGEVGDGALLRPGLRSLRLLLHRWHLLSLDAPTIATLWTALIARSVGLQLSAVSLLAMFLAVWTLYAADRLLDTRLLRNTSFRGPGVLHGVELEPRHHFHHRHRAGFLVAIAGVTSVLGTLLPSLPVAALHLDLVLGALLVGYFVIIHATGGARLPKEIAVGLFFAAAVFIPTISRRPELRRELAPVAILFAALCSLNCVAIYRWEHANLLRPEVTMHRVQRSRPHAVTFWAVTHLLPICCCLAIVALGVAVYPGPGRLDCLAIAAAAVLLLLLDQGRQRLSPVTLRALADLALATPLVLWPMAHLIHRQ